MKFATAINLVFLTGTISYASSLDVYNDQSIYTYKPNNTFIGLSTDIKAKCNGVSVPLHEVTTCPGDKVLCKELISLQDTQHKLMSLQSNTKVLAQLASLPKPTSFNPDELVKTASIIANEEARLYYETEKTIKELEIKETNFQNSATSQNALIAKNICSNELELKIPYGSVSFSTNYEADIDDENINVTQYISVTNKSGINIEADVGNFYYRNANQYVSALHFKPWVLRTYEERKKRKMLKKSMSKSAKNDEITVYAMADAPAPPARVKRKSKASYVDSREYKIENLNLPSQGTATEMKLSSWKAKISCELKVYPYVRTKVLKVCSFEPKHQIDSNSWTIRSGKTTINENAVGEYNKGKYNLYTQVDEDIKISRKHIVKKQRTSGIFGNEIRKKDGYVLTLTNKSNKVKQITVSERVPTSSNEKIKVKLLSVNSSKKLDYKVFEDGKIEMNVKLAANENRKIEVLFEVSYDKDLKVRY